MKILDMGLAHLHAVSEAEATDQDRLIQRGQVMGTCDYMAPEQAEMTKTILTFFRMGYLLLARNEAKRSPATTDCSFPHIRFPPGWALSSQVRKIVSARQQIPNVLPRAECRLLPS